MHRNQGMTGATRTHRKDVLIVDDNPINQVYFSAALRKGGYDILSATSGIEALTNADKWLFHLILMDIRMPEMDGYATVQALRSQSGLNSHTPVVAISAESLEKNKAGLFDDFLIKPVAKHALLELVARFMPGKPVEADTPGGQQAAVDTHRPPANPAPDSRPPAIDRQQALAATGHDPQITQHLQAMLKKELPGQLQDLRQLSKARDALALRELLHRMLGSVSFCGATHLGQQLRHYGAVIKDPASQQAEWDRALQEVEHAAADVMTSINDLTSSG